MELPRGAIIHTNKGDIWLKLFPDEVCCAVCLCGCACCVPPVGVSSLMCCEGRGRGCLWSGVREAQFLTSSPVTAPASLLLPVSLQCPRTVENFTTHSKNGYYDGIIFHR